jgi:Brp/Blh family beta-carotene 15,15'-monooxygenase
VVSAIVFLFEVFSRIRDLNHLGYELLLICVLSILFYSGTLIYGFGVYFVLWHSILSLRSQIKFLYKKKDYNSLKSYLKSSLLYWITAIFSLCLIYFYGNILEEQHLSVFFSFLAAIIFPHAIVMGLMFYSKDPISL